MKTRQGFISNSSSTSFIVPPERKEEAEKYGLKLISVDIIKEWYNKIDKINKELEAIYGESNKHCAEWLFHFYMPHISALEEIKNIPDDYYITEPYDRDRAYENGIDDQFGRFQEDL